MSRGPVAATATCYRSLALEFRVRGALGDRCAQRIADLYRACEAPESRPVELDLTIGFDDAAACHELRSGTEVLYRGGDVDEFVDWFAWRLNQAAVERSTHEFLVLHAAGASAGARGVVLTGPSGAGKSTLVAALTAAGLAYLGEESLGVASDGRLIPNPKPISVDADSRAALAAFSPALAGALSGPALVAPSSVGAVAAPGARVDPALIVQPAYRAGAETRAVPMPAADAAVLLADQSFNFRAMGAAGLRTVASIARRAPAYRLEFGDLAAALAALQHALEHTAAPQLPVSPKAAPDDDDFAVELLGDDALIWDPAAEALHHLSPSARFIWTAARSGTPRSHIVDTVATDTSRDRTGIESEVDDCLRDLRSHNLLR